MRPTPTADFIFETLTAYQRSEALKAAIELDLFTAIAEGHDTAPALARRCQAAPRGVRILADYLVVLGLLLKSEASYGLADGVSGLLDRREPGFVGGSVDFLFSPALRHGFAGLADAVRKGGTAVEHGGALAADHEVWVRFAGGMARRMAPTAEALAEFLDRDRDRPRKILDVAAGHGLFGIALARRSPGAEVFALDFPDVLRVAEENARAAGIGDRFHSLAGDVFEVELGAGYDLVLVTNFLHHFDARTCVGLMRRIHAALRPQGRAVLVEYIPDEDRVSPPRPASFALVMLATTPSGDAYTFSEYGRMLREAGFRHSRLHELPDSLHQVVVSEK